MRHDTSVGSENICFDIENSNVEGIHVAWAEATHQSRSEYFKDG
jgi:hypothetical protein